MDKQALLEYWSGELLAIKMELEKVAFLLNEGIKPSRQIEDHLNNMLDRKKLLEIIIEEIRKQK